MTSILHNCVCSRRRPLLSSLTFVFGLLFLVAVLSAARPAHAQLPKVSRFDRDRALQMLRTVKDDLKKNYYDPTFRGIDLDARFAKAEEEMKDADSNGQLFGIIAQVLIELNDSHTFFSPPSRSARTEYGWQAQVIGDKAFVIAVRPESDAEAKGLKTGDRVVAVDGVTLTRENMWVFQYLYYTLRPTGGMQMVVESPDGKTHELVVLAKIKQGKKVLDLASSSGTDLHRLIIDEEANDRLNRHRLWTANGALTIWKMPQFDLEPSKVDEMMNDIRKQPALILDLRGNGGGYEVTLQRLIGNFFDREIKIGDIKRRKETKEVVAKSRGRDAYDGKLVVLIDSRSGSAAELFARVVQLEKRGIVIGDRSAGAVMRSRRHSHQLGIDTVIFYGVSVTDADIVMTDGKSLEHTGVVPDKLMLPTASDLATGRDPILAHAAALVGIQLDPQKAGSFFPIEWRK